MATMKTAGVYIDEANAFLGSVVPVPTAVPAFIGHTEKAERDDRRPITGVPSRISSMAEYIQLFGAAPPAEFTLSVVSPVPDEDLQAGGFRFGKEAFRLERREADNRRYLLYHSMRLFFQNGGESCYVVSVGGYDEDIAAGDTTSGLIGGLASLSKESEPTIVVIPDAVRLLLDDCASVQSLALANCGTMKDRFAILDVHGGYREFGDPVDNFREAIGTEHLDFGAAYYPWVNTSIVQRGDLGVQNLDAEGKQTLRSLVQRELELNQPPLIEALAGLGSRGYSIVVDQMAAELNVLPPSAAMAGIYTQVDASRGVWKAPANVGVDSVISPTVEITHDEQEGLNVNLRGKSINAIRSFVGEGVLVWGARTLDGNSSDWRYINVRRTAIMVDQSVRQAVAGFVFEPNTASTWATIEAMLSNFLTGMWEQGGLVGASAHDAYEVSVGLGKTMTSADILDGLLRVNVSIAISRPAEFIEITVEQEMQK